MRFHSLIQRVPALIKSVLLRWGAFILQRTNCGQGPFLVGSATTVRRERTGVSLPVWELAERAA
jgi:hypothetical protein